MPISRRGFVGGATSFAIFVPELGYAVPMTAAAKIPGYVAGKVPSEKQLWDWQVWMNNLGTKYTGSPSHKTFVEFLATSLQSFGLTIEREHHTLPRWEAGKYAISVAPKGGAAQTIKVASYYPYSGETPAQGVTAELVYGGTNPNFNKDQDLKGKIVFIDCPGTPVSNANYYSVWGTYEPGLSFPPSIHNAVDQQYVAPALDDFKKAGAVGIILGWKDLSDAQIADQYVPFGRAHQDLPGLWVSHTEGDRLRKLAAAGATATLTLEATITPDTPTDSLIATLPGVNEDEYIVVNTHTDGPNATEENGGVGILGIAKYFASLPKSARPRTMKFYLRTGHFSGRSIQGAATIYPEVMKKTVAALTIEHLAAREWMDDASGRYAATGKNEISLAIVPTKTMADVMLTSLQGSDDNQAVVAGLKTNRFIGEGSTLYRAGIPNIGFIPVPSYLLSGPANGHIDKLDRKLLASQVREFVKVVHQMHTMSPDVLAKASSEQKAMVEAFNKAAAAKGA